MTGLDNYEMENKPMQVDKTEYLDCINKVIHGDCLEVMQKIKPKSVDMILTDLPYGTTACKWDTVINIKNMWSLFNILSKDGCPIILTASQPFTSKLVSSNYPMFKCEWIWRKTHLSNFMLLKSQPAKLHESVLIFGNGKINYFPIKWFVDESKRDKRKTLNDPVTNKVGHVGNVKRIRKADDGSRNPISIIEVPNPNNNSLHETQKPVKLFEYLIKTYSKEGDTVLDCCAGSGTTGIACQNTNRNYILIEKEKKYIDVMYKRGLK